MVQVRAYLLPLSGIECGHASSNFQIRPNIAGANRYVPSPTAAARCAPRCFSEMQSRRTSNHKRISGQQARQEADRFGQFIQGIANASQITVDGRTLGVKFRAEVSSNWPPRFWA